MLREIFAEIFSYPAGVYYKKGAKALFLYSHASAKRERHFEGAAGTQCRSGSGVKSAK